MSCENEKKNALLHEVSMYVLFIEVIFFISKEDTKR